MQISLVYISSYRDSLCPKLIKYVMTVDEEKLKQNQMKQSIHDNVDNKDNKCNINNANDGDDDDDDRS